MPTGSTQQLKPAPSTSSPANTDNWQIRGKRSLVECVHKIEYPVEKTYSVIDHRDFLRPYFYVNELQIGIVPDRAALQACGGIYDLIP